MASGGLGIRFKPNMDGNLHVVDLVSNGPALNSGRIHKNDVLTRIDDIDVLGWDLGRVKPLIVGPKGTPVVLGFARSGSKVPIFVRLERTSLPEPASNVSSSSMGMTLMLGSGSGSRLVMAVASVLNLSEQIKVLREGIDEIPVQHKNVWARGVSFLHGSSRLSGPIAVSRELAKGSWLLGRSPWEDAWIAQWCSVSGEVQWLHMPDEDPRWEQRLSHLNAKLRTKTYLAAERLTLADLAMHNSMAPAVQARAPDGLAAFPNVSRWFDHVQNIPAVKRTLESTVVLDMGVESEPPYQPAPGCAGSDVAVPPALR